MNPKSIIKYVIEAVIVVTVVIGGFFIFKNNAPQQAASVRSIPLACSRTNLTPQIEVSSPNGGETFTAGQQITVKWRTCNIPANAPVSIQVLGGFPGSAINFFETNYSGSNTGSALITLPTIVDNSFMQYGKNFRIKVWIEGYAYDQSDNLFTINGSTTAKRCPADNVSRIYVVSPNGGETFTSGQQITVKWDDCHARSDDSVRIKLAMSSRQGAVTQIVTVPEQPGSFVITLPSMIGSIPVISGNYYKIILEYIDNTVGQLTSGQVLSTDTSDAMFTIQ